MFFIPGCLFPGCPGTSSSWPNCICPALLGTEDDYSPPFWKTYYHFPTGHSKVPLPHYRPECSPFFSLVFLTLLQCTVIAHNASLMRMGKWKFRPQSCASCGPLWASHRCFRLSTREKGVNSGKGLRMHLCLRHLKVQHRNVLTSSWSTKL